MLRGNLMRGGIFVLVAVVLWTPVVLAWTPLRQSSENGAEIPSGSVQEPGWVGWFLDAMRSLLGADVADGGGDIDPNGQTTSIGGCTTGCSTGSGSTSTTTTTSTSSLEVLGGQ